MIVRLVSVNITATPDEITEAIEVARVYNDVDADVADHAVASLKLLADNDLLGHARADGRYTSGCSQASFSN